jgi:SsrA-binding protein
MVINVEIRNRKASYNYFIEKQIEAGISLTGTEIKSVRKGSVDLKDAYCKIKKNEAFIINMYIAKYEEGNRFNHEERRTRKLLLHKNEIKKLSEETNKMGYTLIPLEMYLKNNKAKMLIGVCKGKHLYDKRQAIKEKELKREEKVIIN